MFDVTKFFAVTVDMGPLVILAVLGLVTFLGKLGVTGKAQLVSAMGLGLLFGGGFLIALMGLPATLSGWFAVILCGVTLGLISSGVYETGKGLLAKILARSLGLGETTEKG